MIGHPPPCYYNRLKCRKKIKESPIQCAVPQLPIGLRLHFPGMAIARQKNNVVFPFAMRLQCDRWEYLFRRRLKRKKNARKEGRTCNCIDFRWILFFIPSEYWRTLLLRVSAPPPPTTIRFFFGLARQPFQLIPQWLLPVSIFVFWSFFSPYK